MSMQEPIQARVLLVGAGGLAAPSGTVMARSGVSQLDVADDDRVELGNLHRQLLYATHDVGASKAERAARRLEEEARRAGYALRSDAREERLLPGTALEIVRGYDLVIEGADNFATKFLAADACALAEVPVVHAAAVRWTGWALAVSPGRSACLRCVFEDIPAGRQASCDAAGVMGPVVGALGALQAASALRLLEGDASAAGELWSYDALSKAPRRRRVRSRESCPLCSGRIDGIEAERYAA